MSVFFPSCACYVFIDADRGYDGESSLSGPIVAVARGHSVRILTTLLLSAVLSFRAVYCVSMRTFSVE